MNESAKTVSRAAPGALYSFNTPHQYSAFTGKHRRMGRGHLQIGLSVFVSTITKNGDRLTDVCDVISHRALKKNRHDNIDLCF